MPVVARSHTPHVVVREWLSGPHPEERCGRRLPTAMRLEGWPRARLEQHRVRRHPSRRSHARACDLLRMRVLGCRWVVAALTAFATLPCLGASAVFASDYPERPITIVVPFAPGGANDVVIRVIQQPLAEALGQPIVVE